MRMNFLLLAFVGFLVFGQGGVIASPPKADPNFLLQQIPAAKKPASNERRIIRPLSEQVWRFPNGFEEFYMLLALRSSDKKWCDRISLESQLRKVDARAGLQVIRWRDICLIETAAGSKNAELCRFVRGTKVDVLDGSEFNEKYCRQWTQNANQATKYNNRLHWLQRDPNRPLFLNAQAVLQFLGFTAEDLVRAEQRGFYTNVNQATWQEFLFDYLLFNDKPDALWQGRYAQLMNRAVYLPDFASSAMPVDRFLRYTGTAVQLPADCYENPAAEFTCRMLECLRVRDINACRLIKDSAEIMELRALFIDKCTAKSPNDNSAAAKCQNEVDLPFRKVFFGPPETFLPYLNRTRN